MPTKFNEHRLTVEENVQKFNTNLDTGLSAAQVLKNLAKYGENKLPEPPEKPLWRLVLHQFNDVLVVILLLAALVSFILAYFEQPGERFIAYVEPLVILLILTVNSIVGVYQERSADNSLAALKDLQPRVALVLRKLAEDSNTVPRKRDKIKKSENVSASANDNGTRTYHSNWMVLPIAEVVVGDIVKVTAGDKVPADCRICRLLTTTLGVDQSQLTGETETVFKDELVVGERFMSTDPVDTDSSRFDSGTRTRKSGKRSERTHATTKPAVKGVKLKNEINQDDILSKTNMIFASTSLASGSCIALVVRVGLKTEIGKIQSDVLSVEDDASTPLSRKLDKFSTLLAKVITAICVLVWAINYRHFFDDVHGSVLKGCIYYFKIAVALAVAAVPEGLPAVITTCLALGTRRMAQKNCIVRKLTSVETLGCTTVICTDKTGTLTTNQMCVSSVAVFTIRQQSKPIAKKTGRISNKRTSSNQEMGNEVDIGDDTDLAVNDRFSFLFHDIPGTSYSPLGEVRPAISWGQIWNELCICMSVANDSHITKTNSFSPREYNADHDVDNEEHSRYEKVGDSTEAALRVLVEKIGCHAIDAETHRRFHQKRRGVSCCTSIGERWNQECEKLITFEFTRDRKSMSVLVREKKSDENCLYVKGAPESVLARCTHFMLADGSVFPLTGETTAIVNDQLEKYARKSLRVLAFAKRVDFSRHPEMGSIRTKYEDSASIPSLFKDYSNFVLVESCMIFLGLVALSDPPRLECVGAIKKCRQAGIAVVMVTGDSMATAKAIASQLCIIPTHEKSHKGVNHSKRKPGESDVHANEIVAYTGTEFEQMSRGEQISVMKACIINGGGVFSRTEPRTKQSIVRIFKELGQITAMTGDGVNDAPALKLADIGIAMGITGTEVAKEASAMILADDNFNSIVSAVEEGRSIYNNTQSFIRYLISSNIGEVASIFFTAALGVPEGLQPVQLLWVNLVTDGLPATALGFNPADKDVMSKKPRGADDELLSQWILFRYLVVGIHVGSATVGVIVYYYLFDNNNSDGHSTVTLSQLMNWDRCGEWAGFQVPMVTGMSVGAPCSFFTSGKTKASTLSLTVLVVSEMLNAFNALSENHSLVTIPPWRNPILVAATLGSLIVHFCVLYIPMMASIFGVVPLDLHDWVVVSMFSFPVIIIDELLKLYGRKYMSTEKRTKFREIE